MEYARHLSNGAGAGGHVFAMPIAGNAPRGTWRLDLHADPDAPALASTTLLVEDFLPERIDFDPRAVRPTGRASPTAPLLTVDARYLFGAPGADLAIEGDLRLRAASAVEGWPGYRFGPHDEPVGVEWGAVARAPAPMRPGHAAMRRSTFPEVEAVGRAARRRAARSG